MCSLPYKESGITVDVSDLAGVGLRVVEGDEVVIASPDSDWSIPFPALSVDPTALVGPGLTVADGDDRLSVGLVGSSECKVTTEFGGDFPDALYGRPTDPDHWVFARLSARNGWLQTDVQVYQSYAIDRAGVMEYRPVGE